MKTIRIAMPRLPFHLTGHDMPNHCAFLNSTELSAVVLPKGQPPPNELPTAKLMLTLEDFDADCFMWNSYMMVSENMRRAMALGPSDIQYFNVDASQSAPLPRSKNYQIMHVPVTESMSDQKNLVYRPLKVPKRHVESRLASAVASGRSAELTHEIFYDRFADFIFCTDEFAVKIPQSVCSGMIFFDPFDFFADHRLHFRTLRGVEKEIDWDPIRKIMHTKLTRGVH